MQDIEQIIRKAGGLRKAAEKMGVNAGFFCEVRKEKTPISFDLADKIETHFGIDARDLLTRQLWDQFATFRAAKGKKPSRQKKELEQ
jgi:plasmid maintenance system antidote protein VapI